MKRAKRLPIPEPIKDTVARLEKALGDIDCSVVDTMVRWPAVADQVMAWANSCQNDNCGWLEYQVARLIESKFAEVRRVKS